MAASPRLLDALERRILVPPVMPDGLEVPDGVCLHLSGDAFGTSWRVDVVYSGDGAARWLDALKLQIEGALETIDAQMSLWRPDADIVTFNQASDGIAFALTEPMRQVVKYALDMARLTDGAFDPTLCEAVERWGFGARAVPDGLPDDRELEQLVRERLDWRNIELDGNAIIARSGLTLDLCAIAKGYAVDVVMDAVQAMPAADAALVEIGGELKGWGLRPDGMPWWVQIETADGANDMEALAALCGWAVATSGDYQRSFTHGGRDYCHAIDPQTLAPVQTGVTSVTVFDALCWRADALATAMMVMGREQALAFAHAHDIPCLLRCRGAEGIIEDISATLRSWVDTDD